MNVYEGLSGGGSAEGGEERIMRSEEDGRLPPLFKKGGMEI
jgi:hypothetical protein